MARTQWAPADGSSPAETLLVGEHPIRPEAWHPDGNRLIYREIAGVLSDSRMAMKPGRFIDSGR